MHAKKVCAGWGVGLYFGLSNDTLSVCYRLLNMLLGILHEIFSWNRVIALEKRVTARWLGLMRGSYAGVSGSDLVDIRKLIDFTKRTVEMSLGIIHAS
jgi:hypothetical protein